MVTVFDVAKWFLNKKSFTHKQLQKLCYYAQAWHCALLNRPLFAENFQAWIHGPVCPPLYSKYAEYGWNKIGRLKDSVPKFAPETAEVLRAVYNTYAKFNGEQLESLTHSEKPWQLSRGKLNPLAPSTNIITTASMSEFYGEQYRQAQGD